MTIGPGLAVHQISVNFLVAAIPVIHQVAVIGRFNTPYTRHSESVHDVEIGCASQALIPLGVMEALYRRLSWSGNVVIIILNDAMPQIVVMCIWISVKSMRKTNAIFILP